MSKVSRNFLLLILTLFLVMTPIVLGANILDNVFKPFAGIDIGKTYGLYAPFIDAVIYFILFIGVAGAGLGQTFKDNKSISVIVGVMLAIGMTVFELNSGFNIGKFSPVAALIFFLVIGIFIYNLIKTLTDQTFAAISLAFLVMYGLVQAMSPKLLEWIQSVEWLGTIISIMLVASIIGLIYGIVSLFKGIKSGEVSEKRRERAEKESNNEFAGKQKKEEKALKKEKNAADRMFKLETELGNINNNLAELEKAEANIAQRDHNDRAHQIETLKDLENALNGSWRLQQQLQSAYSNASKSEYSSNPQYLESIKTASQQLDNFINRIKYQLTILLSAIEQSKNLYENDTQKVEQEIANKLNDLLNINNQLIGIDNEFSEVTKDVRKAGIAEDKVAVDELNKALKTSIEAKELLDKLIVANRAILTAQKNIHDLDSRNRNELQKAISVADTNPAKDIGTLRKGLNIGLNTQNIKAENAENKGAINTVAGIINMGYKYLSGDSLRQLYEAVKSVHMNTAKILNELTPIVNNNKVERIKYISECTDIINNVNKIVAANLNKIILDSDANAQKDITAMIGLKDGLKSMINNYKTYIENIKTGKVTKSVLTNYLNNAINNELPKEINKYTSLPNEAVKNLLTIKITEISDILKQLLVINLTDLKSNKDNIRDLFVKALDEIVQNLEKDIAEEMKIYTSIHTSLPGETRLKTLSDSQSKAKVPDFTNVINPTNPVI